MRIKRLVLVSAARPGMRMRRAREGRAEEVSVVEAG